MAEMTPLRRRMIEDMRVRNLLLVTQRCYVHAVAKFARHFNRSPDQLPTMTGISWAGFNVAVCALRFRGGAELKYRTALMTAYATGLRVSEVGRPTIADIDSRRMLTQIEQAKAAGGGDRYVIRVARYGRKARPGHWRRGAADFGRSRTPDRTAGVVKGFGCWLVAAYPPVLRAGVRKPSQIATATHPGYATAVPG